MVHSYRLAFSKAHVLGIRTVQVLYVHAPFRDRYTAIHFKWHPCRDNASTAPANIFYILCAHKRTI
ncbi:hypothetical protein K470DRAFT_27457 [Piedraia hortae CBS 480.64]|uniref:Uncharacterized protein n=1 Tax=Piedraia hortae CBS 480.64 TaxID=1314780 RepID=A0A6A7C3Z1_9PEZI|nr:hypothetical protein K470DRAFT_27457 [Piedraia hortae CBS 480.64]